MKTKDLMIGDWIIIPMSDVPIKVASVNDEGVTIYNEDDYTEYPYYISEIKPIPLTSEILEKNGFKRLQDTYLFNVTTNQFGVNLWLEIGPDSWIENNKIRVDSLKGDFNYPMLTVTTCEYVHEFQHLLKLFGIKKDIKI